jgi:hypothetical protein
MSERWKSALFKYVDGSRPTKPGPITLFRELSRAYDAISIQSGVRFMKGLSISCIRFVVIMALSLAGLVSMPVAAADEKVLIEQVRGADPRVDYPSLTRFGPWDDRNYQLTLEDIAILPANDRYLPTVPAFFKVLKRKEMAEQGFPLVDDLYPREVDKEFQYRFGGLMQNGKLNLTERGKYHYTGPENPNPLKPNRFATDPVARNLDKAAPVSQEGPFDGTLSNNETTIEYHPTNPNIVIAGSNGSGGQRMSFSSNGGLTWGNSGALPGTCCDPAIEYTSNGAIAFAATLGQSGSGCTFGLCSTVYWSFNNGQTWLGPVHMSTASSDKEFIHVDRSPDSPYRDRVYVTWHQGNVMQFARSTALPVQGGAGLQFAAPISFAADERGIGSDIATDRQGRIYHVYPSVTSGSAEMYLLRSDDGGATFVDLNGAAPGLARQIFDLHGRFDFAIPAMESRRVFIYAVVDVDMSGGPRDGRVYVAFTDENAAAGSPGNGTGSAAASHGWLRVIYSDDQGATWTTAASPHSLADQTTVDRFQPWMKVDNVGNVHIGWQDTRNSGAGLRDKADWYYAVSTNGGTSWVEETRVSSVVSQNINNGQEWGDYNGLGISADGQFIGMTWTDNRIVTPPNTTSQRSFAARVQNLFNTPTFLMSASTSVLNVCARTPATTAAAPVTINLNPINGFTGSTALTFPNALPTGVTGTLTPATVPSLPGSSVAQLSANNTATPGTIEVLIRGVSGAVTRETPISLTIATAPPTVSTLTTPANGATGVALSPSFTWAASTQATSYRIDIASDAAFTNIVYSGTQTGTSLNLPLTLASSTQFHWRVTAFNACAVLPAVELFNDGFEDPNGIPTGAVSATGTFTTQAAAGDCPAGPAPTILLSENFNGTVGAGWGPQAGGSGTNSWAVTSAFPFGGTGLSLRGTTPETVSDQRYVSPTIALPAVGNGLTLTFQSRHGLEANAGVTTCFDGGILEVSTNGGTTYTQVPAAQLLTDPYNANVSTAWQSPIAGVPAWCGTQAFTRNVVNLAPYAGQSVQFRFRLTSDATVAEPDGWIIDNVEVKRCN